MISTAMAFFIVWNIGQGQFTSLVTPTKCLHFDAGGEFSVFARVKRLCYKKTNMFYFSHWDWDHISFAQEFQKKQFRMCVRFPTYGTKKKFAQHLFKKLQQCSETELPAEVKTVFQGSNDPKASSNDQSMVYQIKDILIPGDSTAQEEKIWTHHLPGNIHFLVLGHHGSRSSTSQQLLSQLPLLKQAICSARKQKYNHPHGEVVGRLRKNKTPLLKTEEWGHIAFELK